MYRPGVTICTAQWSLYVPPSRHYMYRTLVTICTAQPSLYVQHSGHYMYRTVVTICTTSLTFNNSPFCPHSVFMCFVWIWEQTAIISLYNLNWLVCITETECVYCAVRTGYLKLTFSLAFQGFVNYACSRSTEPLIGRLFLSVLHDEFYVHVTVLHRNKFITFMWPCCIVTNLLRSCDRAAS
jgi:hypothetical protein